MKYYAARSYIFGTYDTVVKDEQGNDCFTLTNQGKVGFNYALCEGKASLSRLLCT